MAASAVGGLQMPENSLTQNDDSTRSNDARDLNAIESRLVKSAEEIEARISELEEEQILTQETLQMEFGI